MQPRPLPTLVLSLFLALPAVGEQPKTPGPDFDAAMSEARAAAQLCLLTHKPGQLYADAEVSLPAPPPPDFPQARSALASFQAVLAGVRDVQEGCALPCTAEVDRAVYTGKIMTLAANLGLADSFLDTAQKNYMLPDGTPRKKTGTGPQSAAARALEAAVVAQMLKNPSLTPERRRGLESKAQTMAEVLTQTKTDQNLTTAGPVTAAPGANTAPDGSRQMTVQQLQQLKDLPRSQAPILRSLATANPPSPAPATKPRQVAATEPVLPPSASPLFRKIFEAAAPLNKTAGNVPADMFATERNRVSGEVLVGAPSLIDGITKLIEGAQREVFIQTYVWAVDDPMSHAILDGFKRLEQRRKREAPGAAPVRVRILVDVTMPNYFLKMNSISKNDIPKLIQQLDALDPKVIQYELAVFPHMAQGCLHSKSVVVDGRFALALTANIQMGTGFNDNMFNAGAVLEGEIASALRSEFANAWENGRTWDPKRNPLLMGRAPRPGALPPLELQTLPGEADWRVPMMVLTRKADGSPFSNRTDSTQDQAFLAAFQNASRRIRILTPNLNDGAVKGAIIDAVKRGVQVDIVFSKGFNDMEMALIGGNNEDAVQSLYAALAAAGLPNVNERLRVRWFSRDGIVAEQGNGPQTSHVKYYSFDDQVAIIGSANMDTQSWRHSRELNVAVDNAETTRRFDSAIFDPAFARGIPVDPSTLKNGLVQLGEGAGKELSKQVTLHPEGTTKLADSELLIQLCQAGSKHNLPPVVQAALYTALLPAQVMLLKNAHNFVDPVTKERGALNSLIQKGAIQESDLRNLYDGWSGRRHFESAHGLKQEPESKNVPKEQQEKVAKVVTAEALKAATLDEGFQRLIIRQPQYQEEVIKEAVELEHAGLRKELNVLGKSSLAHVIPSRNSALKGIEYDPRLYNAKTGPIALQAVKSLASTALNLIPGVGYVRLANAELHTLRDPTLTRTEKVFSTVKNIGDFVGGTMALVMPLASIPAFAVRYIAEAVRNHLYGQQEKRDQEKRAGEPGPPVGNPPATTGLWKRSLPVLALA